MDERPVWTFRGRARRAAARLNPESGSFVLTTCQWFSGSRAGLRLELRDTTLKQVRKALTDGQKVRAEVTIRAKYASGKVATATRTITLALGPKHPPYHGVTHVK
jgi:hypothetical protein